MESFQHNRKMKFNFALLSTQMSNNNPGKFSFWLSSINEKATVSFKETVAY